MQPVNEERDVLLTVLLIIADELVAALAQSPLEDPRVEGRRIAPHEIEQLTEGKDQVAFEAHHVPQVRLLEVELIDYEVLMDGFEIGDNLQGAVHVTRVPQVLKSNRSSTSLRHITEAIRLCLRFDFLGRRAFLLLLPDEVRWVLIRCIAELGIYKLALSEAIVLQCLVQVGAADDLVLDHESTTFNILVERLRCDLEHLVQRSLTANLQLLKR